ncbi:MAG TPA: hypothetical protein EYQ22_05035 [Gammaproteobacteria bacterium]|nr:hypothetical protein [Gammaproteobacteria bacterium]HIK71448.1 hypothetical protein [Pseudomonadales bacterium]
MITNRKKVGTVLGFVALTAAILTVAFWFRLANQVAIPEDRTLFVVAFLGAAGLGVAALIVGPRWFGGIPAILAIAIGGFLTFTVEISPQQVADNPIRVGDIIPVFTALDDQGDRFRSADLAGAPVLIKFFRAHW